MYKYFLFLLLVTLFSTYSHAQLGCFPNNSNIGFGLDYMIGVYGANAGTPASSEMVGRSAEINSMGNYVLKQSIANINNQAAYEYALKNDNLRTELYFQKRQTNGFYTTLEDWQRKEKIRRRKDHDHLTRQDIFDIYGR